jgi:hypothetical protein
VAKEAMKTWLGKQQKENFDFRYFCFDKKTGGLMPKLCNHSFG